MVGGDCVGVRVGVREVDAVREAEADREGLRVGDAVREAEADREGLRVGDAVGDAVGEVLEGEREGDA